MHRVKRAIIMAAGKGNRLRPITNDIPKPLITVRGIKMIDSIINALHVNGIVEIYVVVGYLKEQFTSLKQAYEGLHIIENPFYDTCNNISSLYVAREHIDDTIIIDGDQIISNPKILSPDFERSGYNAVWTDGETDEWLLDVQDGLIKSCSRTGGKRGWQLFSISRWSSEDGKKLKQQLEIEFEQKNNRQIYWDDVPVFCYPHEYSLGIMPMQYEDIKEIDNLDELIALDSKYSKYKEESNAEK